MIVKTHFFTFADEEKLKLEGGGRLGPITIAYETYGQLNKDKNNAILICHALSGGAHAAFKHKKTDRKPGWWDIMIGPGKAFDTDKYFIVCSNVIGSCYGSTGPASINPQTNKPYGLSFPIVTIKDMVNAQRYLIDYLGIKRLLTVAGGSMGGMQVLQWAVSYPDIVHSAMPIATTARMNAQGIAFNEVGRQAIMADPNWNNGDYYGNGKRPPYRGLAVARMIGHITYLSEESMYKKFGRKLQEREKYSYDFATDFQVESYLRYKGDTFVKRFDANSYLYLTKAMDYFDLAMEGNGSLSKAFRKTTASFLVISFSSDWLFSPSQLQDIVRALRNAGRDVSYIDIQSSYGHDAFLLEGDKMTRLIKGFLKERRKEL